MATEHNQSIAHRLWRFSIVLEEVCHGNGDCVAHAG
jgi:hypothetical protein